MTTEAGFFSSKRFIVIFILGDIFVYLFIMFILFIYRSIYLSHYLYSTFPTTFPECVQVNLASAMWIKGWIILNVLPRVEVLQTFSVSRLGTDLRSLHNFISVNGERVLKSIHVPELKKGHVQGHMRRLEPLIFE